MAASTHIASRAQHIHSWLESTSSHDWLHGCDWIHRALAHIVLGLGDQQVQFAQATGEAGSRFGSVVVITDAAIAVASLGADSGPLDGPRTTIVPRHKLRSITVSGASDVIYDPGDVMKRGVVHRWPGEVCLELSVDGLEGAVLLRGPGVNPQASREDGPILHLLHALRDELVGL